MNISTILQRYPKAALGSRKCNCVESGGQTHSCVSQAHVFPGGLIEKDRSEADRWKHRTGPQYKSSDSDFNNSSTYHLCPNTVALWASEPCCLYLKSRIRLQRISSNP